MEKLSNLFNISYLKDNLPNINKYINNDNIAIVGLIIYISIISIYTPRHIVSLINQPVSKLIILGMILYIGNYNLAIGLLMSIALLVTINLDNSLQIVESRNTKEGFVVNEDDDDEDDEDSDSEEEDSDGEEYDDNEEEDSDSEEEDSDGEEIEGEDDFEEYEDDMDGFYDEGFDVNKLKPSKNLDDSFKKLHTAIHDLESFISNDEKNK